MLWKNWKNGGEMTLKDLELAYVEKVMQNAIQPSRPQKEMTAKEEAAEKWHRKHIKSYYYLEFLSSSLDMSKDAFLAGCEFMEKRLEEELKERTGKCIICDSAENLKVCPIMTGDSFDCACKYPVCDYCIRMWYETGITDRDELRARVFKEREEALREEMKNDKAS